MSSGTPLNGHEAALQLRKRDAQRSAGRGRRGRAALSTAARLLLSARVMAHRYLHSRDADVLYRLEFSKSVKQVVQQVTIQNST